MLIRIYTFFSLILLGILPVKAQDFITLKWNKDVNEKMHSHIPTFEEAVFYPGNKLPFYGQNIEIGTDYRHYDYHVKVEYPEYQELSKNEVAAIAGFTHKLDSIPSPDIHLGISAKQGILEVSFIPLVYREGKYWKILSFKLKLDKRPAVMRVAAEQGIDEKYTKNSVLSTGKWVKIQVDETGVYKITNSELAKMGFSNPAKVRLYGYGGFILSQDLRDSRIDDLQEVPLWRESGYVLFYANGTIRWTRNPNVSSTSATSAMEGYKHQQNNYANHAYYFLTESEADPKKFPQITSLDDSGVRTVNTFPDYALYEKEGFSWYRAGSQLYDDYDFKTGNTQSYTFDVTGITDGPAWVTVAFSSSCSASTTVKTEINKKSIGSLNLSRATDSGVAQLGSEMFPWQGAKADKTVVTLNHNCPSNGSGRLDYIRLNYTRNLALYGDFTKFRQLSDGKVKFVVGGADENTRIWDVTDVEGYRWMEGSLSGNNLSFVTQNEIDKEYVAVNVKGTFGKVKVVGEVPNQNLHAFEGIDMIIITPDNSGMVAQAERLAEAHRVKDGISVEVVTSQQVYNEFSSGTPDATAYRWLMKMLYDRAGTSEEKRPKYLLLFGDCAWDNRMLSIDWRKYDPKDFLLCYESVSFHKINSYVMEDYFGMLDDTEAATTDDSSLARDKVDLGIGRFPVRTVDQARQVVDKTIAYMNNEEIGSWKNTVCFLADDAELEHIQNANSLAIGVEKNDSNFIVKRVYWDAYKREASATGYSYPGARQRILEILNEGVLYVDYSGHGSPNELSHERVLKIEDMQQLRSPRLSFWFTAGCDVSPLDSADDSFGESGVLNAKGGMIGLIASTRETYGSSSVKLNRQFTNFVLSTDGNGKRLTTGEALRKAKCALLTPGSGDSDVTRNKLQYVLIGDPALSLAFPSDYTVVVDMLNGHSVEDGAHTVKAGSKVTVKGKIVDANGKVVEGYNGTVYPTVFDSKEEVVTLNNANSGKYTYEDRSKILFAGSDSIRKGEFAFTFPVPLDINYSYESGLINFYTTENESGREGRGYFADFLVGGTDDSVMNGDTLGPKINLYLNTPDFVYGGLVNETPMLVAELEDVDGINAVGNGIGHDLVAIIDNSATYTYVLNSYYTSVLGDYTRGTIRYSLPELPEGKHTLLFRAWDVKNNSSSKELEFEVRKGLKPGLFDVDCTKSPARENTTFILSHDRPEAELDICISVYDFAGRLVWSCMESGISSDNYYYVDWDLTSNAGQRVQPGVYVFRASIASGGSKESTQSRKIVILAQ